MDCASVLKRGYLVDKKAGRLDRSKKWYVLRQDANQGYCVLECYKDEKSSLKGDSPKGFVNVLDVVEVERLHDKKQSFELLCPGVAHRFMANSEAEADEWADLIRQLVSYRRDGIRSVSSLSLPRVPSSPGFSTPVATTIPLTRQLTPLSSSPPMNITIPTSTHTLVIPHHSVRQDHFTLSPSPSHVTGFTLIPANYPTPPETVVSPAHVQVHPAPAQRQVSTDSGNPFPSPPSSSDSSSMCSYSNASFDSASVMDGDNEMMTRNKFRVHLKENEKLGVSGPCDLVVSEDSVTLYCIKSGQPFVSWRIAVLRRYGVNDVCFTFDSGKNCTTGESTFFFYSTQSRIIHTRVHVAAQRLNNIRERRRASAPEPVNKPPPLQHQPASSPGTLSSPPGYSHIEHHLKPSISTEPYEKINKHSSAPTMSTSTDYSTLIHNTTQHCSRTNYATLSHNTSPCSSSPPNKTILSFSRMTLASSTSPSHYANVPTPTSNTNTPSHQPTPPVTRSSSLV